jgi:hypothetical protein
MACSGKLSHIVTNFMVREPPVIVFSMKLWHALPTYMIGLAFHESFLRKMITSY